MFCKYCLYIVCLIISIDGKASAEADKSDSEAQTFLDNVTVEYALTPDGRFRIKVYNQQDYDDFLGGTGVKYGGALVFSKDFAKYRGLSSTGSGNTSY